MYKPSTIAGVIISTTILLAYKIPYPYHVSAICGFLTGVIIALAYQLDSPTNCDYTFSRPVLQ
jgi:hypothetical protein